MPFGDHPGEVGISWIMVVVSVCGEALLLKKKFPQFKAGCDTVLFGFFREQIEGV